MSNAQQAVGPAHLTIDLSKRTLTAQGIALKFIPADLAFYLWLLQRQIDGQPAPQCPSEGAPDLDYACEYLTQYQHIHGALGSTDRTVETLKNGMNKSFFEQRKSRINKQLQQALRHTAVPYLIVAEGRRPRTSYRIALNTEHIEYQ